MPIEQFTPRSFTAVSVRANAPAASSIYGISNAREWIYIGETDNIQASLLNELQQSDSALLKRYPTGFVFELHAGFYMEFRSLPGLSCWTHAYLWLAKLSRFVLHQTLGRLEVCLCAAKLSWIMSG